MTPAQSCTPTGRGAAPVPGTRRSQEGEPALPSEGRIVSHGCCPLPPLLLPRFAGQSDLTALLVVGDEVRICFCAIGEYVAHCVTLSPILNQHGNPPANSIITEWSLYQGTKLALTRGCAHGVHALCSLIGI